MPILKSQDLILVDAKEITIKDDKTGEPLKKWRYLFLNSENKLVKGYDNNGYFKDDVRTVFTYDPKIAKPYLWELSEWNGETKQKLYSGKLPKSK